MRHFFLRFLSTNQYGALVVIGISLAASLNYALVKKIPASPTTLYCVKSLCALVFIGLFLWPRIRTTLSTQRLPWHVLRSFLAVLGTLCLYEALQSAPLADTMVITSTGAIWISLGGVLYAKERFQPAFLIMVLISIVGVAIIYNFNAQAFHLTFAHGLAFFSALCYAAGALLIRVPLQEEPSSHSLFWMVLLCTLLSIPPALYVAEPIPWAWSGMIVLQAFFALLSQGLMIEAYRFGQAWYLAPFKFSRYPIAFLIGYLYFQEVPTPFALYAGVFMVLLQALAACEKQLPRWLIRS